MHGFGSHKDRQCCSLVTSHMEEIITCKHQAREDQILMRSNQAGSGYPNKRGGELNKLVGRS